MSFYLALPLVQALFSLALMVVVLTRRFHSFVHRLFSLFLLGLAAWGVIIFCMRASPDIEHALFWERWLIPLGPAISVFFYHFSAWYAGINVKRWLLPVLYLFVAIFFVPLSVTPLVFSGMQVKSYGYAPILGPLMPLWMLFSYTILLLALLNFLSIFRTSVDAELKNRASYIIAGVVLALIGGSFDILPVLGLPLYPGAIIGNIGFCLLATIAIVRHNLLDIRIAVRKSVAYILTSAVFAIPFVGVFLMVTYFFEEKKSSFWIYLPLLIVLAFGLLPLWQWTQRQVDRWFYRGRYDYLKALETFSRQVQSITDFARLSSVVVDLVGKALRCQSVYFLQSSGPSGGFVQVAYAGSDSPAVDINFSSQSVLIRYLERCDDVLTQEDIEVVPQLQGLTSREKETLERMGAKLIIGLRMPTGLSGLLILGPKLSQEPYTVEDKQLIAAIGSQLATNLENARLYNETLREVRERKLAEDALVKYKMAVDSSADLIAAVDHRYVYILANQAFLKYHCLELDQVVGHTITEILGKEVFKKTVKPNVDRCLGGQSVEYEMEYHFPELGKRHLDVLYHPLRDDSGQTIGVVAAMRDVTERKEAEGREKKLQEELALSSRLAAIGQLAAGVAHEINNPLTAILGFSELLMRRSTDEETVKDLKIIYNEAQRTAQVVRNLLAFARRREPTRQLTDVNDIVQKALELRAYEFKSANIELITKLTPNLPQVLVDFHQIQEVFLNIILNAQQAMDGRKGRGRLLIRTDKMKNCVRISFTDNGPGIHPENLDKIFDPFFTTKAEKGGTGLGLSICHGIVTKHGGRMYVKSKLGRGSTFFVELPVAVHPETEPTISSC